MADELEAKAQVNEQGQLVTERKAARFGVRQTIDVHCVAFLALVLSPYYLTDFAHTDDLSLFDQKFWDIEFAFEITSGRCDALSLRSSVAISILIIAMKRGNRNRGRLGYANVPMNFNGDFWRGKRVLLTGHTGFMGGWLALLLNRFGAIVTGYALPPATTPSFFAAVGLGRLLDDDVRGDVRDLATLADLVCARRPQIIFHLAAQPLVREAFRSPVPDYRRQRDGDGQRSRSRSRRRQFARYCRRHDRQGLRKHRMGLGILAKTTGSAAASPMG